MLSAVSRGLAKAVVPRKPASSAGKSARKYTTGWVTGGLKPAKYTPEETKEVQAFLDKINADPAKLAKFNLFIEQKQQKRAASEKFFKKFPMLRGMKLPEKKSDREVLTAVAIASTQSFSELNYALRYYQEKLQNDEAFYKLHTELRNKDKTAANAALKSVMQALKDIPTKADSVKYAVCHLLRNGLVDEIRTGEALSLANGFIKRFKREVNIEITTAVPASALEKEHYENRFNQLSNDERTKVFISYKEDPSILGGEIIKANGNVYDRSWKSQQEAIMKQIAQANQL